MEPVAKDRGIDAAQPKETGTMLVLSRKLGEGFSIGGNVRVVLIGAKGGKVIVGIEAPADVAILRDELLPTPQEQRDGEGNDCCES